ncbi:MAG TPA: hypothetical protein IAA30_08900 [Candidatus Treponema faecavium]|nr:hypothetical protein [Candidatus Treponema faecavium]
MKKSKKEPYVALAAYKDGIDIKLGAETVMDATAGMLSILMCCAGYFCSIAQIDTDTAIKEVCRLITDGKEVVERQKAVFEKQMFGE